MTQKVIKFEILDSTNNYVAKGLENGQYRDNDVILAGFQTEGRGQRGNIWQSEFGKNLTFSFALRSDFLNLDEQFVISKAVSVGIAKYLEEKLGLPISLKWPNDILIENQKICGILLETKMIDSKRYMIVGIGLNVNQTSFHTEYAATSLSLEFGRPMDLNKELERLLTHLQRYLAQARERMLDGIDDEYLSRLKGTEDFVNLERKGEKFTGKIIYVSNSGEISVKSDDGKLENYLTGQVKINY